MAHIKCVVNDKIELTHERNKGLYALYAAKLRDASELMMRLMLYELPMLSYDVLEEILAAMDHVIRMQWDMQ